ncbi:MAG: 3-deoxy-7-phosphoheptulonate synthase [Planctomycetes bacterium]|nr:3-deoxy-7-phosphoheptulonate synthase [Planctomycetota bacterium]
MTTGTITPEGAASAVQTARAGDDFLVFGALRASINRIDERLLHLLAERAKVATDIGLAKRMTDRPIHDAAREAEHADRLCTVGEALGLAPQVVRDLYQVLARQGFSNQLEAPVAASVTTTPPDSESFRLARIEPGRSPTVVQVGEAQIGAGLFEVIGGPCAVESEQQIHNAADHARAAGVRILRGGAFKPRTSPYDFQGHGMQGLRWLAEAAHSRGMAVVTEVLNPADAEQVAEHAELLQIGARNMQNAPLLRACARTGRAILLKRGPAATIREWLCAAEYILLEGNGQVILCERGLRTFERETRNTLDLSSVAALRHLTHLPVIVDPSHAAGRDELIRPLCRAAHAVGADGIIVEMHPCREEARCDKRQALSPGQLRSITSDVQLVRVRRDE